MVIIRHIGSMQDLRVQLRSKPADTEHIADIVLSDDPDLFFNVVAGRRYSWIACINAIEGASDSNIRYAVTTPDCPSVPVVWGRSFGTAFSTGVPYNSLITGTLVNTNEEIALLIGVLIPATSGVVHLQFAQNVSQATPTTILAGSSLVAYEIS